MIPVQPLEVSVEDMISNLDDSLQPMIPVQPLEVSVEDIFAILDDDPQQVPVQPPSYLLTFQTIESFHLNQELDLEVPIKEDEDERGEIINSPVEERRFFIEGREGNISMRRGKERQPRENKEVRFCFNH